MSIGADIASMNGAANMNLMMVANLYSFSDISSIVSSEFVSV